MKKYIITLLTVLVCNINYGQELTESVSTTTIKAKWSASSSTFLNIENYNEISGYFTGTYGANTATSGQYRVIGFVGSSETDGSVPITLTIHGKPITLSKGTPNEKTTSTMTGQIYLDTQTKAYKMELFNNFSVPLPFTAFKTIGNYSDTLIFTIIGTPSSDPVWSPSPIISSDYTGVWYDENNTSPLLTDKINITAISADNVVQATYKGIDNKIHLLKGFIGGSDSSSINSVSLAGIKSSDNTVISFSGLINKIEASESSFYYDGIYVEGKATGYSARYSAVKVEGFLMVGPQKNSETVTSIELEQQKIPLTNNGATEWVTTTQIGSREGENLKFGVDTGGNFNWANSAQCTTASCTEFNHHQFDQTQSTTFEWIDKTIQKVSWGPWGDGYANLGKDIIHFIPNQESKNDFRLITSFPNNAQFNEFLWDGAIALPSNTSLMLGGMSNFVARLVSTGKVESQENFPVSFYMNAPTKVGKIQIGAVDSTLYDESSKVVLPFKAYSGVEYLWTTPLHSFDLDGKTFGELPYFGVDSGSSALKGDPNAMNGALNYAVQIHDTTGKYPNINFEMGTLATTGQIAKLVVTSDQYVPLIDEGEDAGKKVPQIQALDGVTGLLVQGSTLMNSIYTVFVYGTRINPTTLDIELYAKEMWLYNLKNGPKIIQTASNEEKNNRKELSENNLEIFSNPVKNDIIIKFNTEISGEIFFKLVDMNGRLIYESSRNAKEGFNTFKLKNITENSTKISNQILILSVQNTDKSINLKKKILIE